MIYVALAIIAGLIIAKVVQLSMFWSSCGIPSESYFHYVYRALWLLNTRTFVDVSCDTVERYGRVHGTFRGFQPTLMVADMNLAKEVLIKQFSQFYGRTMEFSTGDPLWDNTLLRLPYDTWKSLRSVMSYTFTTAKMRGIMMKLDKISKRFVNKLQQQSRNGNSEILLKPYLKAYGMDSLVAIAFGLEVNCLEDPNCDFIKYGSELFKPGLTMLVIYLLPSLAKYIPFIDFPPKATSRLFGKMARDVIVEKRKHLAEVEASGTADIIDLHLIAQRDNPDAKHLSDDLLVSQAFLFFIAGADATSLTLELATYLLAVNPEAEERAYQEVKTVLGNRSEIQYEDVIKMKFIEGCILEALRLSPSVSMLDRVCTEETELAGIKIPKGMIVEFPVIAIHRDPTYFPDPDKFMPERFVRNGGLVDEQNLSAFLAFGGGPKNCVGRRLAVMNMQILLANLLLYGRLESGPSTPAYPFRVKPGLRFTDYSKDPLVIRVIPRATC